MMKFLVFGDERSEWWGRLP